MSICYNTSLRELDPPLMLVSAGHSIDAGGLHAAVPQNIRQAEDVLIHRVEFLREPGGAGCAGRPSWTPLPPTGRGFSCRARCCSGRAARPARVANTGPDSIPDRFIYALSASRSFGGRKILRRLPFADTSTRFAATACAVIHRSSLTRMPVEQMVCMIRERRGLLLFAPSRAAAGIPRGSAPCPFRRTSGAAASTA